MKHSIYSTKIKHACMPAAPVTRTVTGSFSTSKALQICLIIFQDKKREPITTRGVSKAINSSICPPSKKTRDDWILQLYSTYSAKERARQKPEGM